MEKKEKKDSIIIATSIDGCTVVFDVASVDGYVNEGGNCVRVWFRSGSESLLKNEVFEELYPDKDLCELLDRFVFALEDGLMKAVFCKNDLGEDVALDVLQVESFNDRNDYLITVCLRSGITLTLSNELDSELYDATLDALLLQIMRHGGYKMV